MLNGECYGDLYNKIVTLNFETIRTITAHETVTHIYYDVYKYSFIQNNRHHIHIFF